MPQKIEVDGVETEVFTAAEIEEIKNGLTATQKAELDKVQADLAAKEETLKGYQSKDQNFQALRTAKEKSDLEATTYKKLHEEAINNVKTEVLDGLLKDEYNSLTKNLLGDDAELVKKFEAEYSRLSDKPTTKEAVQKKVMDAYGLATRMQMPTMHAGVISAANSGYVRPNSNLKISPEDGRMIQEIAAKGGLKISNEEIAKYSK